TRIEQRADAVARQQLVARQVLLARLLATAHRNPCQLFVEIGDQRLQLLAVVAEVFGPGIDLAADDGHGVGRSASWQSLNCTGAGKARPRASEAGRVPRRECGPETRKARRLARLSLDLRGSWRDDQPPAALSLASSTISSFFSSTAS